MSKVTLFKHNEIAYEKLKKALSEHKCATINHATGTGKSFIALKHLYENRDKKYLYLAPTYEILDQLMEDCYKIGITPQDLNVDTMIYRKLLTLDMDELYKQYDGIIFDEYHRAGARKTYRQIKKLKYLLDEHDDGKKFIGLTATPIRFLDKARNMTHELFDGVVASTLSLSEAMLEKILPVPMYINSKIACREEYLDTLNRVNKLEDSEEKKGFLRELSKVHRNIYGENSGTHRQLFNKYITEKDGKYIIFCDNIKSLDKFYNEVDSWFADIGEVKKYKVHSRQLRETNKDQLSKFNKEKDGISVLFCVDILNEGVHVDDIDGVILLRKTMSPIIYFQQIGRALSFSGRNKRIKIFDLVNNFKNHDAIYAIYKELQDELKRKIELHPENREEYEKTLSNFVILDETRSIVDQLSKISGKVTREKVILSKVEHSVRVLAEFSKNHPEKRTRYTLEGSPEARDAYINLSKYYKYVTDEQLEQLIDLDLLLPETLMMPIEERKVVLAGFASIKEKEKNETKILVRNLAEFVALHQRKPTIESEDESERNLAQRYNDVLVNLHPGLKLILKKSFIDNQIELEPWEKILFGEELTDEEIDELISSSQAIVQNKNALPNHIYEALNEFSINYSTSKNEDVFQLIEDSDNIEKEKRIIAEQERQKRISYIIERLESNPTLLEKNLLDEYLLAQIQELRLSDRKYIKKKYLAIKKNYYKDLIKNSDTTSILDFCRQIRSISNNPELLTLWYEKLDSDKKMNLRINDVLDFIDKNDGNFPNPNGDEEERKLSEDLENYLSTGSVATKILELGADYNGVLHSSTEVIRGIARETIKSIEVKQAIIRNIEFFNKTGRRALKNSSNPEEKALAESYDEVCSIYLNSTTVSILNKIFNSRKSIRTTCDAYIRNLQKKEKNLREEK